ncbi:MAG: fatty acid CoA ligase family protein [Polyangia bacterium]
MHNIAVTLCERAQQHPHAIAVHEWHGGLLGGGYSTLTYGELDRDSDDLARGLTAIGIGRGVRTVLMVPPGPDFFALAFGMAKAGVVPVLVDPGMGTQNLRTCLEEAAPEAFIAVPRAHLARVLLGWGKHTIRTSVTVGGAGLLGGHTLDEVRAIGRDRTERTLVPVELDETAAILFTSGSTGVPKGVVYTHGNFGEQVRSLRRISHLGEQEVNLTTFPPFALFDPALGMTTIVPPMDFARPITANPRKLVDAIFRFGVTNLFCSPALLGVLTRWLVENDVHVPSIRRVISAGAPVSLALVRALATRLARAAKILTPYGATEALPVSLVAGHELSAEGICLGHAVPGVQVAIVEVTDAPLTDVRRLPTGEIGEIVVHGDVVTHSYFRRPESTALAKICAPDGLWHRMGDVGRLDVDGRLWFYGRKSERVVLDDRTLYTVPTEALFEHVPGVERVALVGVQRDGTTQPVMCIEGNADVAVLRAIGEPHRLTTFLFHPGFPVDTRHNAKIRRHELARWAEAQRP